MSDVLSKARDEAKKANEASEKSEKDSDAKPSKNAWSDKALQVPQSEVIKLSSSVWRLRARSGISLLRTSATSMRRKLLS